MNLNFNYDENLKCVRFNCHEDCMHDNPQIDSIKLNERPMHQSEIEDIFKYQNYLPYDMPISFECNECGRYYQGKSTGHETADTIDWHIKKPMPEFEFLAETREIYREVYDYIQALASDDFNVDDNEKYIEAIADAALEAICGGNVHDYIESRLDYHESN